MLQENSRVCFLTVIFALSVFVTFLSFWLFLRFSFSSFIPSVRLTTGALWVVSQILLMGHLLFCFRALSVIFVDVVRKAFVYCWFCGFIWVLMSMFLAKLTDGRFASRPSQSLKPKRAEIGRFLPPFRLQSDQSNNCHVIVWGETGASLWWREHHPPHPPSVHHVTLLPLFLYTALSFSFVYFHFFGFVFGKILKCNNNGLKKDSKQTERNNKYI